MSERRHVMKTEVLRNYFRLGLVVTFPGMVTTGESALYMSFLVSGNKLTQFSTKGYDGRILRSSQNWKTTRLQKTSLRMSVAGMHGLPLLAAVIGRLSFSCLLPLCSFPGERLWLAQFGGRHVSVYRNDRKTVLMVVEGGSRKEGGLQRRAKKL